MTVNSSYGLMTGQLCGMMTA